MYFRASQAEDQYALIALNDAEVERHFRTSRVENLVMLSLNGSGVEMILRAPHGS